MAHHRATKCTSQAPEGVLPTTVLRMTGSVTQTGML